MKLLIGYHNGYDATRKYRILEDLGMSKYRAVRLTVLQRFDGSKYLAEGKQEIVHLVNVKEEEIQ